MKNRQNLFTFMFILSIFMMAVPFMALASQVININDAMFFFIGALLCMFGSLFLLNEAK